MRSHDYRPRPIWIFATGLMLTLLAATVPAVHAQCVGNCNADTEVTVDELLVMVNIANGLADLSQCEAADGNGDGEVTIDDILVAVNNALNGCAPIVTPTVSPTATPSPTLGGVTPNPTPTVPALCGNGVVNFDIGETCDDGNLIEGDGCPANCRIRMCTPDGTRLDVNVDFTPPGSTDIEGLTVLLRYEEDRVRIPGTQNSALGAERISNTAENATFAHNDLDYALRVLVTSFDQTALPPGLLLTVQFDNCTGAVRPGAADFRCTVENSNTFGGVAVEGTTCAVSIP